MAVLFITEYATLDGGLPKEPAIAEQTVAIGGASVQSSAFNAETRFVRLQTDAICSVKFGVNPTATATTARMADESSLLVAVPSVLDAGSRLKVAVITNT